LAFGRVHPLRAGAAVREMKNCRASWHQSADTAAIARTSKVIDRRIRDARCAARATTACLRVKNIMALSVLAAGTRPAKTVVLKFYSSTKRIEPVRKTLAKSFYSGANDDDRPSSHCCRKIVGISRQGSSIASGDVCDRRRNVMSIARSHPQAASPSRVISNLLSTLAADDPVAQALRESARRMIGVAVFSGVINILMLSGSLYMLQVYDRVIPSRNIATLFGLSLMVLFAYLVQGYFDAMRARMLCRIATLFDGALQGAIHTALATLPLRGVKPVLRQQPLRDLDQVRGFMSGMGPTAFLDMPWIPVFLIALFLFHPAIGITALLGTVAIIAMTMLTERISRGAAKAAMDMSAQRQVLADVTQRNAEVIRALG
jgi:hypothetical protein